jgi:hypothetical protein
MPNVEDIAVKTAPDPAAWIGINVPIVTPGLFCALGQVDVAGLWRPMQPPLGRGRRWRANLPPVARDWKSPAPRHQGGF